MANTPYKSTVPASSRFDDLEQLIGRLDTIQPNSNYRSSDLISRGLFTADFLRDDRIVYQNGHYIGAQVIYHFAEHNAVDDSRYPQTVAFQALSKFFDVKLGALMGAVGDLLNSGVPALEKGQVKAAYIYDVYAATRSSAPEPDTTTSLSQEIYVEKKYGTITEKEMVECMPRVEHILRNLLRRVRWNIVKDEDWDDLRSAGYMGMMDAAKNFSPSRGATFETYAEIRIKGSILDYMRSSLPLGRHTITLKKKIEKAEDLLTGGLERKPEEEELAAYLGMDVEKLRRRKLRIRTMTETFIGPQNGDTLIGEKFTLDGTLERLIDESMASLFTEVINQLEPRLRTVVQEYYYEGLTMKQIGMHLNVKESRVSQLHARAIRRMREALQDKVPGEFSESLN